MAAVVGSGTVNVCLLNFGQYTLGRALLPLMREVRGLSVGCRRLSTGMPLLKRMMHYSCHHRRYADYCHFRFPLLAFTFKHQRFIRLLYGTRVATRAHCIVLCHGESLEAKDSNIYHHSIYLV